jgi:hypothetical protein
METKQFFETLDYWFKHDAVDLPRIFSEMVTRFINIFVNSVVEYQVPAN